MQRVKRVQIVWNALKKLVRIIRTVVGDINLPQKHCCALNIYFFLQIWQWHVTQ